MEWGRGKGHGEGWEMGEVLKKILEKMTTCYFTNEFVFSVYYADSRP